MEWEEYETRKKLNALHINLMAFSSLCVFSETPNGQHRYESRNQQK